MNALLIEFVKRLETLRNHESRIEAIQDYQVQHIMTDYVASFGNAEDGVVEYVGNTVSPGGLFETGYYYGDVKPKNIVNISAQVGCPAGCKFCELGRLGFVRSLTPEEGLEQVLLMLRIASKQGIPVSSKPHKINIAKSGDLLFNDRVSEFLNLLSVLQFSIKVSTVFPKTSKAFSNFERVAEFAANYMKPVQVQISLISTNEEERRRLSGGVAASFSDLALAGGYWRELNPYGRKINLSLILNNESEADVKRIISMFPPSLFNFRFRPYIPTANGQENQLRVLSPERLANIKQQFSEHGYEVSDWATPTPTEQKFSLSSNSTLERYRAQIGASDLREIR